MKIYIDSNCKCHVVSAAEYRAVETDFFDGKCPEFIEGYRFVPDDTIWVREDGVKFQGEMISPWKPYAELEMAQLRYELEDARKALEVLGVSK